VVVLFAFLLRHRRSPPNADFSGKCALEPASGWHTHCNYEIGGSGPLHARECRVPPGYQATPPDAARDPPPDAVSGGGSRVGPQRQLPIDFASAYRSALTKKGVLGMGMKKDTALNGQASLPAPSATHERILRLLGMTQRPLRSGELENALGLLAGEARGACRWLTENGYITSTVRMGRAAAHWARTFWSLADKGRSWARAQGALVS
jgi:hypothetical protein